MAFLCGAGAQDPEEAEPPRRPRLRVPLGAAAGAVFFAIVLTAFVVGMLMCRCFNKVAAARGGRPRRGTTEPEAEAETDEPPGGIAAATYLTTDAGQGPRQR